MDLTEIFDNILFTFGAFNITIGEIISFSLLTLVLGALYFFLMRKILPYYVEKGVLKRKEEKRLRRYLNLLFFLYGVIELLFSLGLNIEIFSNDHITLTVTNLLIALSILPCAQLAIFLITKVLLPTYFGAVEGEIGGWNKEVFEQDPERSANRMVQSIVYVAAILFVLHNFEFNYVLFEYTGKSDETLQFRISKIFVAIIIILGARFLNWILTHLVLTTYYRQSKINVGSQYAINQLLGYFIYTLGILIALDSLDINLTVVWGSIVGLLVGVGLGLQDTFKDLFSGILLLFERSVEVGDIVEIDGLIGKVKRIGVRTCLVETLENITIVVPNSKLVVQSVINWSHNDEKARFKISIGVAYGSNTELVRNTLLDIALKDERVLKYPSPFVRFANFGDSSLDFELHFWSQELFGIESIKSDLRFEIDKAFRELKVDIPFPQRDIYIKNQGFGNTQE